MPKGIYKFDLSKSKISYSAGLGLQKNYRREQEVRSVTQKSSA